ncbi:MAG: HAD-IIA family hydrolase [archaeon]|nr:HAD-IIA family hydrolase [archaeon]
MYGRVRRQGTNMIKTVLLDLDGTVYEGRRLIDGADTAIEDMRASGLNVFFCTNNSSRPPSSIAKKLRGMGIPCEESDVISSGQIAIEYLVSNKIKNVYLSGTVQQREEFLKKGVDLVDEEHADCTVITMDTEFDYDKMTKAVRAVLRSKTVVLCNRDRLFPREDGLCPGCGSLVAAILYSSNREPDVVLGKPRTYMMEYASRITGSGPEEMLMIGDNIDTDIAMADNFGSPSILIGKSDTRTCAASLKEISGKKMWTYL